MNDIVKESDEPGRRFDVLQALKTAAAPMSVNEISGELGVHPNTVRFHLDALVDAGRVERADAEHTGPGRPPLMFRAARRMDRGGPRSYQLLAEILTIGFTDDDNPSVRAFAAGRAWGRQRAWGQRVARAPETGAAPGPEVSVDRLIGLLDELGFAPEHRRHDPDRPGGEDRIGLRHCPFLELAETRRDIICPIHLGLMQGALETWKVPVAVDRLDAFVEPDRCLAHLSPTTASAAQNSPTGLAVADRADTEEPRARH